MVGNNDHNIEAENKYYHNQWIMQMYSCLLFPTVSITNVMFLKIYYTGSMLNSLTPQNI